MDTKKVLEVLNDMRASGVIQDYALAGAVGAAVYLEPFYTKDIDVFVALEQKGAQKGALIDLSAIGSWEFLPPYSPLTEQALRDANVIPWNDVPVRVVRSEHLVAICLETGRMKDYERIARFIEQEAFDATALRRILADYGLLEKWERFMQRYQQGEWR